MKIQSIVGLVGICCLFSWQFAVAKEHTVKQHDKSFVADTGKIEAIDVVVGDSIKFENADPFFHNIFSLSDLKTFDLGSYKQGESKAVIFDKAGEMDVECAIHPQMYLKVKVK